MQKCIAFGYSCTKSSKLKKIQIWLLILDSLASANEYAEKFRPIAPVIYNPNRLTEPRPPRSISENVENISNAEVNDDDAETNFSEGDDCLDIASGSVDDNSVIVTSNTNDESESAIDDSITPNDIKDPLEAVVLNESEIAVYDDIFNESSSSDQLNEKSSQSACDTHGQTNEIINTSPGGTKRVTKVYGNDCEMSYEFGTDAFKPQPPGYQVKLNDLLSDNIPFKENVRLFNSFECIKNSFFMSVFAIFDLNIFFCR